MILFEKDWDLYPTAIADYKTTNRSFVRYSELLRKRGIKNFAWPLQLLQPELQGVDPYSDSLTDHQKFMIREECIYNPFYFYREVMRVPPIAGIDPIPFIANRGNMSMYWSFYNHVDYMLIQIRQTGKSVGADGLNTQNLYFGLRNGRILLITKDDTLRRENIIRLRNIRGYLPKWLVVDDPNDANNQSVVTYNTAGNILRTAVGQNSEDAALNTGRGASVPVLQSDEGPFTSFIDVTLPAALASGNTARDEAARNNMPYGNIFTTTAGKIDSRSGSYMYKEFYTAGALFDETYYDSVDRADLVKRVKQNCTGRRTLFVGDWDHKQLGYSDEWLYEKLSNSGGTPDSIDRDFFNRWTNGGAMSPLSTAVLEAIGKSEMNPVWMEFGAERFGIKWYALESEIARIAIDKPVILGLDTSDAIGRDAISLVFTDAYSLALLGSATVNEAYLPSVAMWVAKILLKYPKVTLVIEKKSSAQTFIDTAIVVLAKAGIDPTTRMYCRVNDERGKEGGLYEKMQSVAIARRTVEFYDPVRSLFGFNTSGSSRDLLYGIVLTAAAQRCCTKIYDRILSGELRQLTVKNGRIDHSSSGHDDTIIAWLLTHWFLMYGKNLDIYGIDSSKIQLRALKDGSVGTEEDADRLKEQELLNAEIESILGRLKNTSSVHQVITLEAQLRKVLNKLESTGAEPMSIDQLLQDAKKNRIQKMQLRRINNG